MKVTKYNIRVLCPRCALEMERCGYRLERTFNPKASECWKCHRRGLEYVTEKLRG